MANSSIKQTLIFEHPKVRIYNLKEFALPMVLKTWAVNNHIRGDVTIAWDEMSVALPSFLSQVADSIKDKKWAWLSEELCLENGQHIKRIQATEFSFAFHKSAFDQCGPYPPGINGSCDRNLIGKITKMFPGETTSVHADAINLIRLGTNEERERIGPDGRCGQIRLAPALNRDYAAMTEIARTGRRENRLCVVELGRYGDIINILPVLKHIHDNHETPYLMVSSEFADLLDGVSYVKSFVTSLKNEKLGQALSIAKDSFQIVLCAGVWGEGHTPKKCTASYNMDSWNNCGYLDEFENGDWRPLFDRRDMRREEELWDVIRGKDERPVILVNVSKAISSPCPHCHDLLAEIQNMWGNDYHVVNLADHLAHRLYDFIGVFEEAVCLISIDTSFLHLAPATNIPVVALVNPKGDGWASTAVRGGNLVHAIPYDKVNNNNRRELHESIAAALERDVSPFVPLMPVPTVVTKRDVRIFHLVDRRDITDRATQDRLWRCQQSWETLYEHNQLIPAHCWKYGRTAANVLGDKRPLPYLKDLLTHGMEQCEDDDILFFTNDDNIIHPDLPAYLKYHIACHGPCSIFRTEFRGAVPSLELSAENFGKRSIEKHIGRDGFAFTKTWLESMWDVIPDAVLAASMWDVHLACIIRLYYGLKVTNENIWQHLLPAEIPLGYIGHRAHVSAWSLNQNASPANRHNGELFRLFATEYLPNLKVTKEGNLA